MSVGEAVKRGFIQVQAVSAHSLDQRAETSTDSRPKVSVRVESQGPSQSHTPRGLRSERDIIEIECGGGSPRRRSRHRTTTEEEIKEEHTTSIVETEYFVNRARSNERTRIIQPNINERVVINESIQNRHEVQWTSKMIRRIPLAFLFLFRLVSFQNRQYLRQDHHISMIFVQKMKERNSCKFLLNIFRKHRLLRNASTNESMIDNNHGVKKNGNNGTVS